MPIKFKIYNTLTRSEEQLLPLQGNLVRIYTCGPTVYDYQHIGNMRTYIVEDMLVRALEWIGFEVLRVMNITDVGHLTSNADTGEDKMEVGARREGKTAWEIAEFYTKIFLEDLRKLRVREPDVLCKATEHVKEMIAIIAELERRGFTYKIADGVYFDTSKLEDYGKMALVDLEQLKAGARVEMVPGKRNATDFALWKFSPAGAKRQMEWGSPWGRGFPGWHIECSAMSMKYLSGSFVGGEFEPQKFETIDIHAGGVDHINVHHTNEIAQSEGATGKDFVRHWVHGEFLLVEGQKMAKSLRNFYTLADLEEKGHDPLAFRLLCLSSHYRHQMNFTFSALKDAEKNLEALNDFLCKIEDFLKWKSQTEKEKREDDVTAKEVQLIIKEYREKIKLRLADDLNTPEALAALFDFISTVNKLIDRDALDAESLQLVKDFITELDDVLCFLRPRGELTDVEEQLLQKREQARSAKDYARSDEYRSKLKKMGIVLEDTPYGTRWRRTKFAEKE